MPHLHQVLLRCGLVPQPLPCVFFPLLSENREADDDRKVVAEIMRRCFVPTLVTAISWEGFHFVGHEIRITEAMDCYGAIVWPSV